MNRHPFTALLGCVLFATTAASAQSDLSAHEQTFATLTQRLLSTATPAQLQDLGAKDVLALLTPEDRRALGEGHVRFHLSAPAIVTVLRPADAQEATFWLAERGFRPTGQTVRVNDKPYDAFERPFEAVEVSLGISGFDGKTYPYFIALRPAVADGPLSVSKLSPSRLKMGVLTQGAAPLVDRDVTITQLPAALDGQQMIRTSRAHGREAALLARWLRTQSPASTTPDQVSLTWPSDPRTSVAVQWRTSAVVAAGSVVAYRKADASDAPVTIVNAQTRPLSTPDVINDPLVHLHSVRLDNLQPATTYAYCIANSLGGPWTGWTEFTTAPQRKSTAFQFVYLGDVQVGFDAWGGLLHTARSRHPAAAFNLLAGDLVDRGHARDDWDDFFANAKDAFAGRPIVPVLGNHEVLQGRPPALYRSFFDLPTNGPASLDPEHAYSFEYGDALFVILDSNADPAVQTAWLDQTLGRSTATWKFVSFHHPLYPSHPKRNHDNLLRAWGPVLDKHRVDMVLQGHDHAYLRTHPMRANARADSAAHGTYYVVSVSGTKFYEQASRPYTAVGFDRTSTYQTIDIDPNGRLLYRAYDAAGTVRDEVTIQKSPAPSAKAP